MSDQRDKPNTSKVTNEPTQDQERGESRHATMPPGRSDLALKRYENLHEKPEKQKDHSLQERAKERAEHPQDLNAGTAHDWEDLEAYKKELDRLDREGPKVKNP